MADVVQRLQPGSALLVRIKGMIGSALRTWFIGQITLRHSHIVRTKNTRSRARKRRSEDSQRRNTRLAAHRFQSQPIENSRIEGRHRFRASQHPISSDQFIGAEQFVPVFGVLLE